MASSAPPLSRLNKLAFGFGSIGIGAKNTAFGTFLLFYYERVIGAPAAVVSAAIFCALVVDAISDPIVGRISDRFHSRLGRRHPFIYGAALPTAIFFLLVWSPIEGMSNSGMFLWLFGFASLTRLSITFYEIPSSAMTPELAPDYDQRTTLFSYRYWFGYAGGLGLSALALLVFLAPTPDYPYGQLNPAGYFPYKVTGAIMIFVAILICAIGTHNRIPYLRQADLSATRLGIFDHLKSIFSAFSHKGFVSIAAFGIFKYSAIGLYAAVTLYFGTYLWQLGSRALFLLTIDGFFAATLALFMAPFFSKRLGKKRTAVTMVICGIAIGISPLILRYFGLFFSNDSPALLPVLFVIGVVYGSMIATSLIMTSSMLADVVEDHAVKTGEHSSGVFFSANSFMMKCSAGVGILVAGLVLQLAGFPQDASPDTVTPETLDRLLRTYIPCSLGLWFVGLLCLIPYRIDRSTHEDNLRRLAAADDTVVAPAAPPRAMPEGSAEPAS